MTIRLRTTFFIGLTVLVVWFLYIERAILTPFILAAIFAYVFNPVVNFISHRIKLPRTLSILIIYFLLVGGIVFLSTILTRQILKESVELRSYVENLLETAKHQVNSLPSWASPVANEALRSVEKSNFFSISSFFNFFPQAISGIIGFLIFLFSAFYFLKEGRRMLDNFLHFVPNDYRIEVEILIRRINKVFGGYLRGILLLILIVSLMTFIALSILGVRFALVLAIFTGFAEIVPFIGPIFAGTIAAITVFINGVSNFPITPIQGVLVVAAIYFVIRQIQDYFVSPYVIGKIVGLHPLVILFAVISGEHILGVLGFVLAVPIAAALKILLEFSLDKINQQSFKSLTTKIS